MTTNIQHILMRTKDEDIQSLYEGENVTKTMIQQSLDRIREWYKYQPHLPRIELDERYLIRHLIATKYDEERLKKRIDSLITARTLWPNIFGNRDPSGSVLSKALDSVEFVLMPSLTDEKYRIVVIKANIDSNENFSIDTILLCSCIIADIRLYADACLGDLYVWDFGYLTFNNVTQIHLPTLKNLPYILQSCYGSPIKGVHIINTPPFVDLAINVIKAGLSAKVSGRFFNHSTMESFQKSFPMKYLPKDMGGDEPQTLKEMSLEWGKAIKAPEMRKWIMDFDSIMKTDESKRLNKSDLIMSDLGTRGTFRKLDLD